MDEIALHIEFLLHSHDCVIVPGLGGFVLNFTEVERSGLWGMNAPMCELIFNSKLNYNDGLLAESLMKSNSINFENAISKINLACNELKNKLSNGELIVWNNLGTFKELNEDKRPVFYSNKSYILPQYYGLTKARLKPVTILSSKNTNNQNSIPLKPFFHYVSSAIAIALLLFFIVVSYNSYEPKSQKAEIVSKSLIFNKHESQGSINKSTKTSIATNTATKKTIDINSTDSSSPTNISIALNHAQSQSNYYIVVGVYEVRDVAEKTLNTLKKQGFTNASMLQRPGRLDVYSASFSNKHEAQDYLKKFLTENPKHHDAWLLKY